MKITRLFFIVSVSVIALLLSSCDNMANKRLFVQPLENNKTVPSEIIDFGPNLRSYEVKNFRVVKVKVFEYRPNNEQTLLYETTIHKEDVDSDSIFVAINQHSFLEEYEYYVSVYAKKKVRTSFAIHEAYPELFDGLMHHSTDYSGLDSAIPVRSNIPYLLTFSTFSTGADLMQSITFSVEGIDDALKEDLLHEEVVVIGTVIEVLDNSEVDKNS